MIVRMWRTQVDPARANEYREFALTRSLPMFRAQRGFGGVVFGAKGADRAVITFWHDAAAVDALDSSRSYADTVAAIEATGFLRGESSVDVFEVEGMFLEEGTTEA